MAQKCRKATGDGGVPRFSFSLHKHAEMGNGILFVINYIRLLVAVQNRILTQAYSGWLISSGKLCKCPCGWTIPLPFMCNREITQAIQMILPVPNVRTLLKKTVYVRSNSPSMSFLRYHHFQSTFSIFTPLCDLAVKLWKTSCFQGPVFFYYGLSNYYQNYRSYGVSVDLNQLVGERKYFLVWSCLMHHS